MKEILTKVDFNEEYGCDIIGTIAELDELDFNVFIDSLKSNNVNYEFQFSGDVIVENCDIVFDILNTMGFEQI